MDKEDWNSLRYEFPCPKIDHLTLFSRHLLARPAFIHLEVEIEHGHVIEREVCERSRTEPDVRKDRASHKAEEGLGAGSSNGYVAQQNA